VKYLSENFIPCKEVCQEAIPTYFIKLSAQNIYAL